MKACTFSLILPTYNPGGLLGETLKEITPFAASHPDWEVVFVCDGCTDGTDRELEEYVKKHETMRVIRYSRNRGKGHAVRIGLLRARGSYRIFTDVDLAYPLGMTETIAEQLAGGNDIVIASRAHPESHIEISDNVRSYMSRRNSQSQVFSFIARKLLGIRQRDPQAGLKGISARAARLLMPYVKCNGFGFDCELLVACRFFGLHVREVPIHVRYTHPHSTTRFSSSMKMARDLWDIRRRWRRTGRRGLPRSVFSTWGPIGSTEVDDVLGTEDSSR